MNKYEVMFIAKPLEDAEVDPIAEFVSNLIKKKMAAMSKRLIVGANATWHTLSKNRLTVTTY